MGLLLIPLVFLFFIVILGMGINLFLVGVKKKDSKSKFLGLAFSLLTLIVGYSTIENTLSGV